MTNERRRNGHRVTLDMTEEGVRHAFLRVGPKTVLMLERPGFRDSDVLARADWTTLTLD
jgi:hypothetical protein